MRSSPQEVLRDECRVDEGDGIVCGDASGEAPEELSSGRTKATAGSVMHKLTGGCHCGNIHVDLDLTRAPSAYNPRTCDCEYCRKHGASYVSDPHGSLVIRIRDQHNLGKYRQGGGLAEFLLCRNCGVLVGVLYSCDERFYAAINANVTDAREIFGAPQVVSPRKLSGQEKMQRWQELWFSNVDLISVEA